MHTYISIQTCVFTRPCKHTQTYTPLASCILHRVLHCLSIACPDNIEKYTTDISVREKLFIT